MSQYQLNDIVCILSCSWSIYGKGVDEPKTQKDRCLCSGPSFNYLTSQIAQLNVFVKTCQMSH